MRSTRPSGGTPGRDRVTEPDKSAATETLRAEQGSLERIYLECKDAEFPLPPLQAVALGDFEPRPVIASAVGSREVERTVLAGSIAPTQRKVGPSLEVAELGRGGIGRVFVSIDMALQREIAIKELLPELLEGEPEVVTALRARFLREARVTGQLEHPNIVPVYEVGQRDDGRLYYAMRLIRGKTLKDALDQAFDLSSRLALLHHFLGLCHAMAYAHSRGVIHRDIKPQNVMLGAFGETIVLDWGVAKLGKVADSAPEVEAIREPTEGRPEQTRMGQVLGTPVYMAPEALQGRADQIDERSDVWSLGVVLYLLLCGRLPFQGSLAALISKAGSLVAAPPRTHNPEIPAELSAVVERALQLAPEHRYANAGEMAADIEAYLTGAKVGAYAYSSWDLLRRFYARQRLAVLVTLTALAALLALSVVGYRGVVEARDRALFAEQQQRLSATKAEERLAESLAKEASFALARQDTASAELLAARALNVVPRPDARGVIASVSPEAQPRLVASREFHQHCTRVAVAVSSGALACTSKSHIVVVLGERTTVLKRHQKQVTGVALLADTKRMISSDESGTLVVWSLPEGEVLEQKKLSRGAISALAASLDERLLAIGYADGRAELRHASDLMLLAEYSIGEPVSELAISSSGAIAVGGRFGALSVWSNTTVREPVRFSGHYGTLTALAFAPDGMRLATGSADQNVRVFNVARPSEHPALVGRGRVAKSFAWSKSGQHLVYGTDGQRLHWVDIRLKRAISELPGHNDSVLAVAFSRDERELVSIDSQLNLRRWGIPDARWLQRLVEPGNVLALASIPASRGLISAGLGPHGICLWDLKRAECETRLPFRSEQVRALATTSDGTRLAAGGKQGELLLWDLKTRLPLASLTGHRGDVRSLAFSKDDRRLISADLRGELKMWSLASTLATVQRNAGAGVHAVRFSPDGTLVAVATRDGEVQLWDGKLGARRHVLAGHADWVMDVAFVSQTQLASAGADHSVRLWDLERQQELIEFSAGRGRVLSLDASADGRYLAAGGEDKLVRIWDLQSRMLVATLNDHEGAVRSVRFLKGDRALASASDDRSVRLWDLKVLTTRPQLLLENAEKRYGVQSRAVQPPQ